MFRPHWLTAVDEPGDRPYERRWAALVVLCTAVLVGQVDTTIVNVALTSIGEDLGATTSDLQWTMDAYAVTLAGLVLAGGGVADRFGRRRVFMIGLVVFAVGSIGALFATEPWHLIASRAVMGLGAALFFPPALSLLAVLFPKEERARAVAIWALIGGLGTALGPVIGGVLLDSFWWGSVFVVNLPVAVAAFFGAAVLFPESTRPDADALDRTGALLSIIGLAALVFGLIEGPGRGWTDPSIIIALAIGVGALVLFVRYELRHPHPMVHVDVFRHPAVTGGAIAIIAGGMCMFGMFFLVPQVLENVRGDSTIVTGLLLAPFGITFIPLALLADRFVKKYGV
ncbi:MAG: MFS transporter, partial [Actinomycetota bacterium]